MEERKKRMEKGGQNNLCKKMQNTEQSIQRGKKGTGGEKSATQEQKN